MQSVLSIDISGEEALIAVFSVEGSRVELLEKCRLAIGDQFSKERLSNSQTITIGAAETGSENTAEQAEENFFAKALSQIKSPWQRGVLVISPYDSISLSLDLPFSDPKSVAKIIDLEVQDLVPFNLDEFLVQHKVIGRLAADKFDTHVSVIPKRYISAILSSCAKAKFEPALVCTPPSALPAVFVLAKNYVAPNSGLIYSCGANHYLSLGIDGLARSERLITRRIIKPDGSKDDTAIQLLYAELKIAIAAIERRYQKNIDAIYLLGIGLEPTAVQQALGRNTETLGPTELIPGSDHDFCIGGMAAALAYESGSSALLTNYRTKEFSYSPQVRELVAAARSLLPHLLAALIVALISLGLTYFLRENRIAKISDAIIQEIETSFPNIGAVRGQELAGLEEARRELKRKLDELGSPSQTNPLEVLTEVSERVARTKGVEIQRIRVQGEKITLEVGLDDFSASDLLMRKLRQSRKFCSIQEKTSGVAGNAKISVEMSLCKE